jgi:YggT family protein
MNGALLILVAFINLFVSVFNVLLVIRVLMSYFVSPQNQFYLLMVSLTEPVLAPVRKVLPQGGMVDWAPLATFFLLQGLRYLVNRLIGG